MLFFGVFGVTAFTSAATASTALTATGGSPVSVQDEGDAQNDTISLPEAMEVAANETADRNGTVVGGERVQAGGLLASDTDPELAYTVNVLFPDGTHVQIAVNGTNGSVVSSEEQNEGFLENIFDETDVPNQPLNLSAMHDATEAVALARNETDANGTVTAVNLDQRNDGLVYEVEFTRADDGRRTVIVAAMKDGEGVLDPGEG